MPLGEATKVKLELQWRTQDAEGPEPCGSGEQCCKLRVESVQEKGCVGCSKQTWSGSPEAAEPVSLRISEPHMQLWVSVVLCSTVPCGMGVFTLPLCM